MDRIAEILDTMLTWYDEDGTESRFQVRDAVARLGPIDTKLNSCFNDFRNDQ